MSRALCLAELLQSVVTGRYDAWLGSETGRARGESDDGYLVALSAIAAFFGQDFEELDRRAARAIAIADGPEARTVAAAAGAFARAACAWMPLPQQAAADGGLRAAVAGLDEVDRALEHEPDGADRAAFARYLVAEAAIACARLDLAEAALGAGRMWRGFFARGGRSHPFFPIMQVLVVRVALFTGQVDEALAALQTIDLAHPQTRPQLVAAATDCLVRGAASQRPRVLGLARELSGMGGGEPDYVDSGYRVLLGYALSAIGEPRRAAQQFIIASRTPAFDGLIIIDRVLALEALVGFALGEGDDEAADAWAHVATGLASHPIAAPAVDRMQARMLLRRGDAASALVLAERASAELAAQHRMVERYEADLLAAECRLQLGEGRAAVATMEGLALTAESAGYFAVRRTAARTLRSRGRRLRPTVGGGWDSLSLREQEVARAIVEGLDTAQIAARLSISPHTVRGHVSRILTAFAVPTRLALAVALADELFPVEAAPALTPSQERVVAAVVRGATNADIARALDISVKTVEKHVGDVMRRWGETSRVGVVRRARRRPPIASE